MLRAGNQLISSGLDLLIRDDPEESDRGTDAEDGGAEDLDERRDVIVDGDRIAQREQRVWPNPALVKDALGIEDDVAFVVMETPRG